MKTYRITDPKFQDLCFAYCAGKSPIWRLFYGWRKTSFKENDLSVCYFTLSKKSYNELNEIFQGSI